MFSTYILFTNKRFSERNFKYFVGVKERVPDNTTASILSSPSVYPNKKKNKSKGHCYPDLVQS